MVDITDVLYVDGNVLIAEFPEEMEMTDETFAKVNERFEELASQPAVDTHISNLQMEASLNDDVFTRAQEAAEAGKEFGISDWIIVSEGIKKMALKSRVGEISGVDISLVDTKAEAMELATA
ncbi:hypothetical protein SAMN05443574_10777 [Haloarcula vallismortis]|uniref:Uncharacterized protein n=2 Tax=Haloarcula vallismortis TaxID=28442 RepID=M0JK50_HALVA|nr:hypothetical protein [Haloarcula vallismortis]EMA09396.1 hypothetical protein C437_05880 [Haloarcula vallismortis ATCC 29715]SDW81705.1 hypothetical protein SAMN05443574_10777 [Haloarcula vallismortis]